MDISKIRGNKAFTSIIWNTCKIGINGRLWLWQWNLQFDLHFNILCSVLFLCDPGINRDARKCWKMGPKGSFDVATGAAARKRRLWQSRAECTPTTAQSTSNTKKIQLQTQLPTVANSGASIQCASNRLSIHKYSLEAITSFKLNYL